MGYALNINHDLKFIHYQHNGLIERKEIGDAWREMLSKEEFTKKGYNILTDYRDGKFNFTIEATDAIENFLNEIRHILDGKKNAVIVDKPSEFAISMLVGSGKIKKMNYFVELFSTEQAAIEYLKI